MLIDNERLEMLESISRPVDIIVDYPLYLDNDDISNLEENYEIGDNDGK